MRLRVSPFTHPLAASAIDFRVTPDIDPLAAAGDGGPRRLDCSHPSALRTVKLRVAPTLPCLPRLRPDLRVSPHHKSSGFTGDGTSRRVEGSILRRCRLTVSGLPPTAFLRYRRRPVSGSPRNLHLPVPADEFRGLPRFVHPPVSPGRNFGLPRTSLSGSSFSPQPHIAMALRSSGGADGSFSDSPRIAVLQRCRFRSLGLPRFHFRGWVDDEPRLFPNFASSACAADESSCPIRFRISCLALNVFSISLDFSLPAEPAADYRRGPFKHREPNRNCCPTPYRVTN